MQAAPCKKTLRVLICFLYPVVSVFRCGEHTQVHLQLPADMLFCFRVARYWHKTVEMAFLYWQNIQFSN